MAKKKIEINEPIQTPSLTEDKPIETPTVNVVKDPLADKVKALRDKGFDDNRIAATLMIQVSTLNDYK